MAQLPHQLAIIPQYVVILRFAPRAIYDDMMKLKR